MPIVICKVDYAKLVLENYKPKVITEIGKSKVEITLKDAKVIDVVDKDPLLQQKLVDAGQKAVADKAEATAKYLMDLDSKAEKILAKSGLKSDVDSFAESFADQFERDIEAAGADAEKALSVVWKKHLKDKPEYLKYKISTGCSVALGAIGVGASIAGVVGSAATGNVLGVVVGAVAAFKGAASAIQTGMMFAIDVGTAVTLLQAEFNLVVKKYEDFSDANKTGQEIAKDAVAAFLGVQVPSLRKSEKDIGNIRKKLRGVSVKMHEASKDLNTALKKWDELEKKAKSGLPSNLVGKLRTQMDKVAEEAGSLIDKIINLTTKADDASAKTDVIEEGVVALQSGVNEKLIKVAHVALRTAALLVDVWGGATTEKDFKEITASLGHAVSGCSTLQDVVEDYFDKE